MIYSSKVSAGRRMLILTVAVLACVVIGAGVIAGPDRIDIDLNAGSGTVLASQWQQYFGRHYTTGAGPWNTVRGFGGPHVRLEQKRSGDGGDSRTAIGSPFSGKQVPISLTEISRHKADSASIDELLPRVIRRGIDVIYPPFGWPNKDRCYAALRRLFERFPRAGEHIYLQIGNEVNGVGHFNPVGLKELAKKRGLSRWHYFNSPLQQDIYIRQLEPTIEAIRRVSTDVFGAPDRINVILGTIANSYNPSSRQWLYSLLDREMAGTRAPSLVADRVRKYIDIVSVHYPFARGPHADKTGQQAMQEIYEQCVAKGDVEGVWITEEHGNHGRGPVTIVRRGMKFIEWVSRDGLDARQARLMWWGDDRKKAGGKGAIAVRLLGQFLAGRRLSLIVAKAPQFAVYTLLAREDGQIERLCAAVVPAVDAAAVRLSSIRVDVPAGWPQKWQGQFVRYSETASPDIEKLNAESDSHGGLTVDLHCAPDECAVVLLRPADDNGGN